MEDTSMLTSFRSSSVWNRSPTWTKTHHDYEQLDFKNFVKETKPIAKVLEPKTHEKALVEPHTKEWQQTMKEEHDSQIEKEGADGLIERAKAKIDFSAWTDPSWGEDLEGSRTCPELCTSWI